MKIIRILIIHGPNLNLTGQREQEIYGSGSLEDLGPEMEKLKTSYPGLEVSSFQTNNEGEMVSAIQKAPGDKYHGIVINPGGFTHTSVAVADALKASKLPVVEVHLSNIYAREDFRRHNLIAPVCTGGISGLGLTGYVLGVVYLAGKMA